MILVNNKDLPIFDINNYSDLDEALEEGNKLFKELYIDDRIEFYDVYSQCNAHVQFSPKNTIEYKNKIFFQRFFHIVSRDKDESGNKYNNYPCENTDYDCDRDCILNFFPDYRQKTIERMICPFRLTSIKYFSEIIRLYNLKDQRIKIFEEVRTKNGRYSYFINFVYIENKRMILAVIQKVEHGDRFKYYFVTCYSVSSIKRKQKILKNFSKKK